VRFRTLIVGIVLLLAALTRARSAAWHSELSLWSDSSSKSPGLARPFLNHGLALTHIGQQTKSLPYFLIAEKNAALNPIPKHRMMETAAARSNIAFLMMIQRRYEEAEAWADGAVSAWPELRSARMNRGTARILMGRCEEGAFDYFMAGAQEIPPCG
jgi:hypothetical protein